MPESLFKFKNLFIEHGEKKRQVKDSRYSEAAIVSYVSILNFFSKSLKNPGKRLRFGNAAGHMTAAIFKHFSGIYQQLF